MGETEAWRKVLIPRLDTCRCLGLVGLGACGEAIRQEALERHLEMELCDPPRSLQESEDIGEEFFQLWGNGMGGCEMTCSDVEAFVPLAVLAQRCDLISVQVPLVETGACPTKGLVSREFLEACRQDACVLCLSDPRVVAPEVTDDPRIVYA